MSVNCYKLSPESKDRKPILKEDFLIVLGQSLFLSFFFSLDVLCLSLTSVSMYDCNFLCVCISILLRPRVCACVCVFGGGEVVGSAGFEPAIATVPCSWMKAKAPQGGTLARGRTRLARS